MKNNKTTELAANTNLAGWKIISRTISLREFRERWVQTVQYWKFETEWPGYLSGAFSTRTLFIFAKTIHFCYIIITYCRHVWWRCDHMISSDQTSGRHQPDTGDTRHVTSGVTMSGYTRQTECRYVVERKSKILSRGKKREKRPTDTIKAVDSQASLVASLYCPVVVSHSCSHSQIRGSLAIKVITALIRAEIHPLPSSGGLIVRDNGVTMDLETENEQECRCWGR